MCQVHTVCDVRLTVQLYRELKARRIPCEPDQSGTSRLISHTDATSCLSSSHGYFDRKGVILSSKLQQANPDLLFLLRGIFVCVKSKTSLPQEVSPFESNFVLQKNSDTSFPKYMYVFVCFSNAQFVVVKTNENHISRP